MMSTECWPKCFKTTKLLLPPAKAEGVCLSQTPSNQGKASRSLRKKAFKRKNGKRNGNQIKKIKSLDFKY